MRDNGRMKWIAASFATLLVCGSSYGQIHVADRGRVQTAIVVAPDAIEPEVNAARTLQQTLSEMAHVSIPIVRAGARLPQHAILVGQGDAQRKLFPGINWAKLGEEEVLIQEKGDYLLVSGGRNRGTLYAVNRLLYKLGVRTWTPWARDVPNKPRLVIGAVNERSIPAFESRDSYWFHSFDQDWAVQNYDNGANTRVDLNHGGKIEYGGFVHTYYPLVPPEKYFGPHPEWYSLIDGKRTTVDAQLCTTNPELRDFVVEQVRQLIRSNPKVRIVSVSQNDCFRPCQCDKCRALVKEQGSESALVLDLANYVAEKIEKEFPLVAIDTLAYQWSRHAPKSMKPRPNVIVRLCSIECNFAFPLDGPPNDAFARDVQDWERLTNRLYIWDYCTDFANYTEPQPDYFTFGKTLKFLAHHGAKGLFEEGAYQSTGADMAELKAWVLAQLMWNPDQDSDALVSEFVSGYYGKAASPILQYLKFMQQKATSWHLSFASPVSASFLGYETMVQAEKFMQAAERLASNDPEKLWRVEQAHLAVQYVFLARWQEFRDAAKAKGDAWIVNASRKAFAENWLKVATGAGPTGWSPMTVVDEGSRTPQQFVASALAGD